MMQSGVLVFLWRSMLGICADQADWVLRRTMGIFRVATPC